MFHKFSFHIKKIVTGILLLSFSSLFAYHEGMFDTSEEIDSLYMDYREIDIQSASEFISYNKYSNIFFEDFENAFFLKSDDILHKDEFYSLFKRGEYQKITEMKTSNYIQIFIKVLSFYRLEKYTNAVAVLDSIKNCPESSIDNFSIIIKAASFYKLKDNLKSLQLLENCNDDYSILLKSIIFYEQNRDDSVLKYIKNVKSEIIEPLRSYMLLNVYYNKKDYSNTINMIERFESKYPDFEMILNMKYIKAQILYKRGYFKKSIMALQDIVLGSDSNSILLGNAYYLIGKNYFMLGNYDKMEEYLTIVKMDAAKSDFKKNAEFLDGKGFFLKGDFRKASEKLIKFVKKYPDDELTQYAYQLLVQAFFYQKNYKKSQFYMSMLKSPSFYAEKLVLMKYFINYKNKIYPDSISAYLDFIAKETNNPLRRETYEIIVKEAESESLKIWAFDNLNKEYPESENIIYYAFSLCSIIIKNCSEEQIQRILANVNRYRFDEFGLLYIQFIREMFRRECYPQIVELYSKYSRDLKTERSESSYITALSLKEMKNIDGALFMLDALSQEESEFGDSSVIKKAMIYYEMYDATYIEKFISENMSVRNPFVEGELYRIYGKKLFDQKKYKESKSAYLQAVDLFKDNRNMAALALLDCSIASMQTEEREEAVIFAEKALLLATDIEVINKLKVHLDKIK